MSVVSLTTAMSEGLLVESQLECEEPVVGWHGQDHGQSDNQWKDASFLNEKLDWHKDKCL